jgi:rubrerythrin
MEEEDQTIHKEYEWECNECGYTSIITIEPDSAKALKDTHQKETGHSKGFLFIVTKIMTD